MTSFMCIIHMEKKYRSFINEMHIQVVLGIIAILIILYMLFGRSSKSGFSDVKIKKEDEVCPNGYETLGPILCGRK